MYVLILRNKYFYSKEKNYYEEGHFCPIIERNTVVPVSRTERLYTIYDNQTSNKNRKFYKEKLDFLKIIFY